VNGAGGLLWGFHPIREALRERAEEVAKVLVAASRGGGRRAEILALCAAHRVPVQVLPDAELERRAPGVHNGFLAELVVLGRRLPLSPASAPRRFEGLPSSLPALVSPSAGGGDSEGAAAPPDPAPAAPLSAQPVTPPAQPAASTAPPTAPPAARAEAVATADRLLAGELRVLVEDVQDPRNLGALLRVCEGAGVRQVLVRDRGSAPLGATAAKTSAGALAHLDVERIPNSAAAIERAQQEGFWVYALESGGEPPWSIDLTGKVMICVGGEEKGLRERTRKLCDGVIGLPMLGHVESLNLSTAAAAVLYEAVRQRLTGSPPPSSKKRS
jgi:tRNA G18 (ribose-2'-O)-methylase SpoU